MRFRVDLENGEWVARAEDGTELARGANPWEVMRGPHAFVRSQLMGLEAFQEDGERGDRIAWRSAPAISYEDTPTRDGRIIDGGASRWNSDLLPLPLMLLTETTDGHYEAELCGTIENLGRSGNEITADGLFDRSEAGDRAAAVLADHPRYGISIDGGEYEVEIECAEEDEDGFCMELLFRFTDLEIMGATLCPWPAFAEAAVELTDGIPEEEPGAEEEETSEAATTENAPVEAARVAAAIPTQPPASWFEDLEFGAFGEDDRLARNELTGTVGAPMTITDDGEIFGHCALWGTCHIGSPDNCLPPPNSATDYAYFRTGELQPTDCDCDAVPVGQITLGGGHADTNLGVRPAIEHYDETGVAVADVVVGEDAYGIWYHGALRPGVTEEQVRTLLASSVSGDWRRIGGNLEMVALAAVNVPGYPIPRAHVATGRTLALVAAGAGPVARLQGRPRNTGSIGVRIDMSQLSGLVDEVRFLRALVDPTPDERARIAAAYRERIGEPERVPSMIGATPTG